MKKNLFSKVFIDFFCGIILLILFLHVLTIFSSATSVLDKPVLASFNINKNINHVKVNIKKYVNSYNYRMDYYKNNTIVMHKKCLLCPAYNYKAIILSIIDSTNTKVELKINNSALPISFLKKAVDSYLYDVKFNLNH